MKIKFSGIGIVDGRGKINGSVISKNKSGSYARVKVSPSNPKSIYQSAVRATFAFIAQAWAILTESQRAAWNSATSEWSSTDVFGDIRILTGKALFQGVNMVRSLFGNGVLMAPIEKAALPQISALVVTADASDDEVTVEFNSSAAGYVLIYGTPSVSKGITSRPASLSRFFKQSTVVSGTNTLNVSSEYVARFGAPVAGKKIFIDIIAASPTAGNRGTALVNFCEVDA